jgi:hypothetical protein
MAATSRMHQVVSFVKAFAVVRAECGTSYLHAVSRSSCRQATGVITGLRWTALARPLAVRSFQNGILIFHGNIRGGHTP